MHRRFAPTAPPAPPRQAARPSCVRTWPDFKDISIRAGENPPEEQWLRPDQIPDRIAKHLWEGDRVIVCRFVHGGPASYQIARAGALYQPGDNAKKLAAKTAAAPKPSAPQYPSYKATPTVTVRLSAAEKAALERLAQSLGVSLSDVVRARLSAAAKPISALTALELKAELEAHRAEAYAQLEDFERADAATIKDPAARARFVAKRLERKRAK